MFRKTLFGHFLDAKLVSNGHMCHYILLKEVKNEWDDVISFKLLGHKASFGWKDFDIITGLRFRSRRAVQLEEKKALRLRRLYLGDRTNINEFKWDKNYPTLNF